MALLCFAKRHEHQPPSQHAMLNHGVYWRYGWRSKINAYVEMESR